MRGRALVTTLPCLVGHREPKSHQSLCSPASANARGVHHWDLGCIGSQTASLLALCFAAGGSLMRGSARVGHTSDRGFEVLKTRPPVEGYPVWELSKGERRSNLRRMQLLLPFCANTLASLRSWPFQISGYVPQPPTNKQKGCPLSFNFQPWLNLVEDQARRLFHIGRTGFP